MGQTAPAPRHRRRRGHDAEDRIEVIVDWKSGVDIDAERLNSYHREIKVVGIKVANGRC
jgi:hypothetical protein